jgi:hypothetical protein
MVDSSDSENAGGILSDDGELDMDSTECGTTKISSSLSSRVRLAEYHLKQYQSLMYQVLRRYTGFSTRINVVRKRKRDQSTTHHHHMSEGIHHKVDTRTHQPVLSSEEGTEISKPSTVSSTHFCHDFTLTSSESPQIEAGGIAL